MMHNVIHGNILQGFAVSSNKIQGVTTLKQIEAFGLKRPTEIDKANKSMDDKALKSHNLHAVTNRSFDKPRMDNAGDYSGYIEAVETGKRIGGTPAITLYHPATLDITDNGVLVPYGSVLVAIDGETQTEARFMLMGRLEESGNWPIAYTLYHGISPEAAQQILHDYNMKGLPWSEMKAARFNNTGVLSRGVEDAIKLSGVSPEKVNYRGSKATKKHIVSLEQLLVFSAGVQLNGRGSDVAVSSGDLKRLNTPNSTALAPMAVPTMTHLLRIADENRTLGAMPSMIWQVAGVLTSKGVTFEALNWKAAALKYKETAVSGKGGPRMKVSDRIKAIEAAMASK
jgi:hypothetical protein